MALLCSKTVVGGEPLDIRPDIRLVIASLAGGGAERVCLLLANSWAAQGRRVEILTVRRHGEYLSMLDSRVTLHSPDANRTLRALFWMRQRLNRWKDVPAIVFGIDIAVGLGVFKWLGVLRAPLIYREGSLPHENVVAKCRWTYSVCVRHLDALIAQTDEALGSLRRLGLANVPAMVIWNPVLPPPGGRERASDSVTKGPRCLSIGRLSSEKGWMRLLQAFVRLRQEWPGATLDVVGQGSLLPEMQEAIRDLGLSHEVRLHGFIEGVQRFYCQADLFILPSFYEGQSNALIEALLHGCRVVAAGGASTRELLDRIGLADCAIGAGAFDEELVAAVIRANTLPANAWSSARQLLRERTDVASVGERYYGFCHQIATGAL